MPSRLTRRQFLRTCTTLSVASALIGMTGCTISPRRPAIRTLLRQPASHLLYYASFDRGPSPDLAARDTHFQASGARFWRVLGEDGQALAAYPGSYIRYQAAGNVLAERGTLMAGVKLLQGFGTRADGDSPHHRFVVIRSAQSTDAIYLEAVANPEPQIQVSFQHGETSRTLVASLPAQYLKIGQWHHVAVTWDGPAGVAGLYVDGVLTQIDRRFATLLALNGDLLIGGDVDGLSPAFAELDEIRIYNIAFSAEHVQAAFAEFDAGRRAADTMSWSPGIPSLIGWDFVRPPDFSFVVLADMHFDDHDHKIEYVISPRVEEILRQVNGLQPAFVVNCGDMNTFWPGSPGYAPACRATREALANLGMPIYYVAGNHDIGNKLSMPRSAGPHISDAAIADYRSQFGADYYAFDYQGCRFIVVNTQLLGSEDKLPAAKVQWQWLEEELGRKGQRFTFLLGHLPLFWAEPNDLDIGNYEVCDEPARSRLLDLLRHRQNTILFSGHTHHPFSTVVDELRLFTVPSTTFGRPHGRKKDPPADAVIFDEWRLGYHVARVYSDRCVVNQVQGFPHAFPAVPLQSGNHQPLRRFLCQTAQDVDDGILGLVSPSFPVIERGLWDPSYVIDGVDGTTSQDDMHGWTSADHNGPYEDEWIGVDLLDEREIERVEITPRGGGWRFPVAYALEISRDGGQWEIVSARNRGPVSKTTLTLSFPPRKARLVRFRSKEMIGPTRPYRMSVMELRVFGPEGINYAREGRAFARTSFDPRRVVDDRSWQLASFIGAKWLRVAPAAFNWSDIEIRRGVYRLSLAQERALTLAAPLGVHLALPLVTSHPFYSESERRAKFGEFARYLIARLADRVAGWEVIYAGEPLEEYASFLEEARRHLLNVSPSARVIAGPFESSERFQPDPLLGKAEVAVLKLNLAGSLSGLNGRLEVLRRRVAPLELWVEVTLSDVESLNSGQIAARLAMIFLACQETGTRMFWGHAPGQPGGLLDAMGDPTEYCYTAQILTTLFDTNGRPVTPMAQLTSRTGEVLELSAFEVGERLYLVCRRPRPADENREPVPADLVVEAPWCNWAIGVDTLSACGQDLIWSRQGSQIRISGLLVRDHPVIIVLLRSHTPHKPLPYMFKTVD